MSSQIFAGDISGSVTIQCPNVAGTNVLTLPLSNGLIPGEMIYRLNTSLVGTQALTAQSVLGVGITLNSGTVYQFEGFYALSKTVGAVTHTIGYGFGGTATLNNITYTRGWGYSATSFVTPISAAGQLQVAGFVQTANSTSFPSESAATASMYWMVPLKGTVSVNVGGTFIPQYTLSADPGGAYTTAAGSYFKISPIAASVGSVNIGGWA